MSDIRIYSAANMPDSPLTGDVVICSEAFNSAPANSVHLCTNATGPVWKSFENDGAVTPPFTENSLSFDGSDLMSVGTISELNASSSFTLSTWFNYNELVTVITGSGVNSNARFAIRPQTTSSMRVTLNGGLYDVPLGISGGIISSNWYHLACVISGTSVTLYINGSASDGGSVTTSHTLSSGWADDLDIGRNSPNWTNNHRPFNGKLDDLAFFDTALTEAQIASLIDTSGANPVPADLSSFINNGLAAWYRMGDDANDTFVDGGSVASITDSSGNGYTATQATAANQPTFSVDTPS